MKAKKQLGQHFLKSLNVVNCIVRASNIQNDDTILEIGPGKGILTSALLKKAKNVIAVEKDKQLVEYLKEKFSAEIKNEKLVLVHDDILQCDLSKFKIQNSKFKLIANIPYYITGEILRKVLSCDIQPSSMTILVQKEVAERIVVRKKPLDSPRRGSGQAARGKSLDVARGKPFDKTQGKESILSLSVKAYGTPRYVKTVPARYFSPKPKVDSAILVIENISKKFFTGDEHTNEHTMVCSLCSTNEEKFFKLIKTGFAHKRKLLIKNLEPLFKAWGMQDIFTQCDIPQKTRAENLSLKQWKCLADATNN